MKAGPLSDCNEVGNPKQGVISFGSVWELQQTSHVVGKASTHPEMMSMSVSKYWIS